MPGFWAEHSDRCRLDSWCASLGHGADRRAFLGSWSASGSADGYVRTAYQIVEGLQISAARAARSSLGGGAHLLGEEQTLKALHDFLVARGVPEEAARLQRLYLKSANPTLEVPALHGQELARPELLAQQDAELLNTQRAALRAASPERWVPSAASDPLATPATPTVAAESEGDEVLGDCVSDLEEEDSDAARTSIDMEASEAAPHGFVVAEVSAKMRRLHFVGECFRAPGMHYRSFRSFVDECPPMEAFDRRCKDCFPRCCWGEVLAGDRGRRE